MQFTAIWSTKILDCIYLESEKPGSLQFGEAKTLVHIYFVQEKSDPCSLKPKRVWLTTLWSKKKEDDCYFKTEKQFHIHLEHEKNGSQLFGARKVCITSIQKPKNLDYCHLEAKKLDESYLEQDKSESLLFASEKTD